MVCVLVAWELIYFMLFKISVWLIFWWVAGYCKSNLGKQNLKYKCVSWKYLIIDMNMNLSCSLLSSCRLAWNINAYCSVEAEETVPLTLAVMRNIGSLVAGSSRRWFLPLSCLGAAEHPSGCTAPLPAPHPALWGWAVGTVCNQLLLALNQQRHAKKEVFFFSFYNLVLCTNALMLLMCLVLCLSVHLVRGGVSLLLKFAW